MINFEHAPVVVPGDGPATLSRLSRHEDLENLSMTMALALVAALLAGPALAGSLPIDGTTKFHTAEVQQTVLHDSGDCQAADDGRRRPAKR